jgi:hypothetical protein
MRVDAKAQVEQVPDLLTLENSKSRPHANRTAMRKHAGRR